MNHDAPQTDRPTIPAPSSTADTIPAPPASVDLRRCAARPDARALWSVDAWLMGALGGELDR